MSYCRWGADSDVYVYPDVYGGITCCGCHISEHRSHNEKDAIGMIRHLEEHERAGERVPKYAFDRLLGETEEAAPVVREALHYEDDWNDEESSQ